MLIHANGITRETNAPVELYHVDPGSGCVLIGNAFARILLTPDEVRALHDLLEPFLDGKAENPPST